METDSGMIKHSEMSLFGTFKQEGVDMELRIRTRYHTFDHDPDKISHIELFWGRNYLDTVMIDYPDPKVVMSA